LYSLEFKSSVKKDLKKVEISDIKFLKKSLEVFIENFSYEYEIELMKTGKIKKLVGEEELYRLRVRNYRVIYEKQQEKLVILVVHIKSREGAYK